MRTTNIRFTGLASGLDTESLVQAMVQPYKMKYDSSVQDKKLLELKKDKYKEVNNKVLKFYDEQVRKLRLESSFIKKESNISNPNLIDINGSLADGNYDIEVKQLAQGAMLETKQVNADEKTGLDKLGFEKNDKVTLTVDGKPISITIEEVDDTTAPGGKRLMNIGELEQKMNDAIKAYPEGDGVEQLTAGQKAGIQFKFDNQAKGFQISSQQTSIKMSVENVGAGSTGSLAQLGITKAEASVQPGQIKYNGMLIESTTNEFKVDGATITAKGVGNVSVSTKLSTDHAFDTIKGFVDGYNTLIEELNLLIDAPYNKDYKPLTDEQKKEMSESDIKLWEERINNSILRKDPTLQRLTSTMREITGGFVADGDFKTLSEIGITTSSDWSEKGKLHIDETKLKKAIENNPEGVMNLFIGEGKVDTDGKEIPNTKGIAERMYDSISDMFKGTTLNSSMFLFNDKVLDKEIKQQEEEATKLQKRMQSAEDRYYKQFTAMEKMLHQMNSQSSFLMSQMGGM